MAKWEYYDRQVNLTLFPGTNRSSNTEIHPALETGRGFPFPVPSRLTFQRKCADVENSIVTFVQLDRPMFNALKAIAHEDLFNPIVFRIQSFDHSPRPDHAS